MKAIAITIAALGLAGCAAKQLDPAKSLSGQTTLVGCLSPGNAPGEYILTGGGGGPRTTIVGHPDLQAHSANHAIRVVGMLNREIPTAGLKAIHIEHLAASCQTPF